MSDRSAAVRVRPPSGEDAGAVARLAAELGYPAGDDAVRSRLAALSCDARAHFVAVAEAGGALVGWVHAEHRVGLESGDRAELVGLVVAAPARRGGAGKALVHAAERWAAARGLASIVVRSNVVRPESHAFYERIGYARTKTQHAYAKPLYPERPRMTGQDKPDAAARQKSLELLFDYTKFHIGLYLTLTAAYIAVATAEIEGEPLLALEPRFFWPAIVAFMVAGLGGGVIASSITQQVNVSSLEFLDQPIGPWDWQAIHFRARIWTYIEHTSFWLGLVLAVLSFV